MSRGEKTPHFLFPTHCEATGERKASVVWIATDPISWIEGLARRVEYQETAQLKRPSSPLRINGQDLATDQKRFKWDTSQSNSKANFRGSSLVKVPAENVDSETNEPGSFVRSSSSETLNSARSKSEVGSYMNEWLCQNWINPYPDERSLHHLARKCNTKPLVITNWLINARNRKWRPANIRAFDLGRPSEMLLEDAIRIYRNEPLRPMDSNNGMPPRKRFREV